MEASPDCLTAGLKAKGIYGLGGGYALLLVVAGAPRTLPYLTSPFLFPSLSHPPFAIAIFRSPGRS